MAGERGRDRRSKSAIICFTLARWVDLSPTSSIIVSPSGASTCSEYVDSTNSVAALSYATYNVSGNTLYINLQDAARADSQFSVGLGSTSSATATVSLELETGGPARNGYAAYFFPDANWSGGGGGGASLSIAADDNPFSCSGHDFINCDSEAWPTSEATAMANLAPFRLGQEFSFNATEAASARGDVTECLGDISAATDIELKFFESDRVTLVDVTLVPEPSSVGMIILGLGLGACLISAVPRSISRIWLVGEES